MDEKRGFQEIVQLIKTTLVINYANNNIERNPIHAWTATKIPQVFYENIPYFQDADGKEINSNDLKIIIGEYCYSTIDEITLAMAAINQNRKDKGLPQIAPNIEKFLEFIETEEKAVKATPK